MTTAVWAVYPVLHVIQHGGSVSFKTLCKELLDFDPRRFETEKNVQTAIDNYSACLTIEGEDVLFDRNAGKYSKIPLYERMVQAALHKVLPDKMKEFQLYPFLDTKNSQACYIGMPWSSIPSGSFERDSTYPDFCDYRTQGEDSCRLGCGLEASVLENYRNPAQKKPYTVTSKTTIADLIQLFEKNRGVHVRIDDTEAMLIIGTIDPEYDFLANKNYRLLESIQISSDIMIPKPYIGDFETIKAIHIDTPDTMTF